MSATFSVSINETVHPYIAHGKGMCKEFKKVPQVRLRPHPGNAECK